jgi:hypothetical protein
MGLTDRVLGAKRELPSSRPSESRSDALIVDRYQRMLRTADTRAIECVRESPVCLTEQRLLEVSDER